MDTIKRRQDQRWHRMDMTGQSSDHFQGELAALSTAHRMMCLEQMNMFILDPIERLVLREVATEMVATE